MMKSNHLAYAVLAALLSIQTLPASAAKSDTASAVEASGQEAQQASDSIANYVDDQIVQGPATIDLGNQAKLETACKNGLCEKKSRQCHDEGSRQRHRSQPLRPDSPRVGNEDGDTN